MTSSLRRRVETFLVGRLAPAAARVELLAARRARPGTTAWLRGTEQRYGGFVSKIERRRVSALDPRTSVQIATGGMVGGDRMSRFRHNYAPTYARHLHRWVNGRHQPVLAEVGILQGSGLAIWCDLFPDGAVLGLDIDLSHFTQNQARLRDRGAFRLNRPELLEFDAYAPDPAVLTEFLGGRCIDIVIDDGPHSAQAIAATAEALKSHLAPEFTYFVEDNPQCRETVSEILQARQHEVGSGGLVVAWS